MKKTAKKGYDEIFKVLEKHKDICIFDISDLKLKAALHLFGIDLKETHGLNIGDRRISSLDWNKFGDYRSIAKWGEVHNRTISWSADGRQPKNEILLQICFPTGAFIFGTGGTFNKDYPTDFFEKFWLELKSFKPDYTDEANHGLYWNVKNAKEIFNSFDSILNKYHKLNKEDLKQRKIKKMKEELEKLESK